MLLFSFCLLLIFIRLPFTSVWHITALPIWQELIILLWLKHLRCIQLPALFLRVWLVNMHDSDREIHRFLDSLGLFVFNIECVTDYDINGNCCCRNISAYSLLVYKDFFCHKV